MEDLQGKKIILTGSEGLIGKSIKSYLEARNAVVIGVDIDFQQAGRNDHVVDLTKKESVIKLIETIEDRYINIDGLVNNAYPRTPDWGCRFEDIKYESWQQNVEMQLNAMFLLTQLTLHHMKERKNGSIVNIASIYGVVGNDFSVYDGTDMTSPAAYSAIKGGIINFTRYLASYFGSHGIRVNCLSPGGIFNNQNQTFVSNFEKKVPLKRMGNPDDIAGPVGFLLSDISRYITGHNLIVDGGWTAI